VLDHERPLLLVHGEGFEAVPLGARSIPGLVAPIEIWRIALPEREDELPLSFAE
jgi:hypothetical protein